jgi:voltage-gated sodium channel
MTGWQWAYFDTVIVSIQVVEEILIVAQGSASIDLGFLKMLKMGRLLRMIRMVRLLPELKSIVILIMASMSSFVWTCVLLLLLVYMLSVYMVMMAIDVLEESNSIVESESRDLLFRYWGSLGSAILSVYWSVTGGQDWAVVIGPLNEQTGTQFHNVVFCMFIAFATMVLMNLVTGVFVEGAQRLTKEDRDRELAKLAHKVFRLVDDDSVRKSHERNLTGI